MTEVITRLEDVRPGDVGFGPIGGWFGPLVSAGELIVDGGFHVGPLDVRHVLIVTEASRVEGPQDIGAFDLGGVTAPKAVQAMPGGAEEIELKYAMHWTGKWAYARMTEDYPGQALDAAAIARAMLGTPYSPLSYAALAAWHWGLSTPKLEAWIGRRGPLTDIAGISPGRFLSVCLPLEAICSVLADQAWSLTGKKIMTGVPHQCVTPSQFAARLLFGAEDLVSAWGFPAEHPYP